MKETINPTELAAMDAVRQKTRPELGKRSPRIDHIDHRRLTYFMIEDRIADYEAAGIERTLYVHASCCVHRRPQLDQCMDVMFVRKFDHRMAVWAFALLLLAHDVQQFGRKGWKSDICNQIAYFLLDLAEFSAFLLRPPAKSTKICHIWRDIHAVMLML